ncbi:hypothetical protein SASPL_146017 [Salvia splendens]|uniref:Phosphoinositide phospholipase C n=1 Tax=Salvia splendens TaxID=180675 RepID=A0A8X8WJ64_SALSN|nr:hypothetical protein SASPL_146017 [Salvia splendens]
MDVDFEEENLRSLQIEEDEGPIRPSSRIRRRIRIESEVSRPNTAQLADTPRIRIDGVSVAYRYRIRIRYVIRQQGGVSVLYRDVTETDEDDEKDPKVGSQAAPQYRDLIAIPAGRGKGGMQAWLRVDPTKVRRISLSEQKLEDAISEYGQDIVRSTQKNILRIYPRAIRLDSSNYKPLCALMHGAQMVALNMQGYGKSLWLMHGMFRANGGCGYVKKPDFLLDADEVFDPEAELPVKTTLRVTVYMGEGWYYDFSHTHFDTYSPPDFRAKIAIVGVPADKKKKKTKTIDDNWIPSWDEVFEFPLTVPELALLRLQVSEEDVSGKTMFAGQTCLPVSELREGIRASSLSHHISSLISNFRNNRLPKSEMSSKQTYRVCFCFRRRFRLAASEAPPDVKKLFAEYSENGVMDAEHLRRFMENVQQQKDATVEDAQAVIDSLKHLSIFHRRGFNLEGFFKYLFADDNQPINTKLGVHHDMTGPLSHYFIYTGHNSYLTGNQLSSDCSDVPIINALHRGVRVIELDIWPNSAGDNVNVLHGRTLTTPVELIKCLRSIKENAFVASEYPLVITLEDHLTPDLQAKVAEMINETFGDILFAPGSECLKDFPSPEFLKKRVIISTKPPKEYLKAKDVKVQEGGLKKEKDEEAWGSEPNYAKNDKEQQNEAPEYRQLIAIHAGKGKGGMQDWLRVDPDKVRRLSLSEQELEKAIVDYGRDIVRFTQRNLLRVYPKGIRFDSSNYNPLIAWSHGAQMVAFNMQGYGRSLWVMHGMFRANGGCGYVKKPDILLKPNAYGEVFDPNASLPVKTTLRVTVYMGEGWYYDFRHTHFDTYSPPDFYARVGIAGVPADTIMKKTKTLEDNWIPNWDEVFEFPLRVPELALLRIEVHEYDMSEKDDFAGQTCLPVTELCKGIRAVPLHNRKGVKYNSVKLLMRFEFV